MKPLFLQCYFQRISTCTWPLSGKTLVEMVMYLCHKGKGQNIPLRGLDRPRVFQEVGVPYFKTAGTWRWEGCQSYAPAVFTPQERFLVLCSVRDCVNPRPIVRPEGLSQWKIPMTPSGMEPATFQLSAFIWLRVTVDAGHGKCNIESMLW
jgi:hypothetical protein